MQSVMKRKIDISEIDKWPERKMGRWFKHNFINLGDGAQKKSHLHIGNGV
jgi:hypothetical protein